MIKSLIAVNFHQFHKQSDLERCLRSLNRSLILAQRSHDSVIDIIIFNSSGKKIKITPFVCQYQEIVITPAPNGLGLNEQIKYAIEKSYDLFFRVDGDDTVSERRFSRQLKLFKNYDYDVVGGGLIYKSIDDNSEVIVMPYKRPKSFSFLINKFFLHPTLAFKLSFIKANNIFYESTRLEDKKLAIMLHQNAASIYNDQSIYGTYYYSNKARSKLSIVILNFKFNCLYIKSSEGHKLLKYFSALIIFLTGVFIPVRFLRRFTVYFNKRCAVKQHVL